MRALVVASLLLLACTQLPAEPNVVVMVDTDAPLPGGAVPALFDHLRVEVFRPGQTDACKGCTHDFALTEALVNGGKASFGTSVVPATHGYRVRLRLFLDRSSPPPPGAVVEVVGTLPAVVQGTAVVHVTLHVDDVGSPVGTLDAPVSMELGAFARGHAGTWAGAPSVPCDGQREDEVCVPGGAFWMGSRDAQLGPGAAFAADDERIVVLSPFALAQREVNVADWKAWPGSRKATFVTWSGQNVGTAFADFCSFPAVASDTTRDALPMNCMTLAAAQAFCAARGASLPTEAQYEYVAGGMASLPYAWGYDEPGCDDAVFGLGDWLGIENGGSRACRGDGVLGGPRAPSAARRDKVTFPTGDLLDIAGNLSEWSRDSFELQGGTCWTTGVVADPVCNLAHATGQSTRGGNWSSVPSTLRAASRNTFPPGNVNPVLGFRCARDLPAPRQKESEANRRRSSRRRRQGREWRTSADRALCGAPSPPPAGDGLPSMPATLGCRAARRP